MATVQSTYTKIKIKVYHTKQKTNHKYYRHGIQANEVIKSAGIEENTPVVFIGSTNDRLDTDVQIIYSHFEGKLKLVSADRQVKNW